MTGDPDWKSLAGDSEHAPPHVLVVDDDPMILQLHAAMLRHSGCAVDVEVDGQAAWEALNRHRYDLMVTDNNMPKLSGLELLQKVREARMELPVIMATGTMPKEQLSPFPWLQPAAILLKPYSAQVFLGTVETVLRARDHACGQIAPEQTWPSQPAADPAGYFMATIANPANSAGAGPMKLRHGGNTP